MYARQVKAMSQVDNRIHKMGIGYFSLCNFIKMYTQSSWAHRTLSDFQKKSLVHQQY